MLLKFSLLFALICFLGNTAQSQLLDKLKRRVETKVKSRAESKVDRTIDKGLDKAEGTVDSKKKSKTQNSESEGAEIENEGPTNSGKQSSAKTNLATLGKFDFVPGEKVLFIEDFSQDNLGDFPTKWNTDGSGDLVKVEGQTNKFLHLKKDNVLYPEFIKSLPENFTMEFDLISTDQFSFYTGGFHFGFTTTENVGKDWKTFQRFGNRKDGTKQTLEFFVHPTNAGGNLGITGLASLGTGAVVIDKGTDQDEFTTKGGNTFVHVSIWRQKNRVRVYLNEKKIFDLPKAIPEATLYKTVYFRTQDFGNDNDAYYFGNLKLAVGDPDTRNKLITEGKFVTTGILFDVNSATVKTESYGVIKEIAGVLAENAAVNVKIIGHTDSDGDDNSNLELSKKRAEAVKDVLISTYNIGADRLTTDGKGESAPADKGTTAEAKANNRRVEFIKQ